MPEWETRGPGDEDRLAGAERERACELHRLVITDESDLPEARKASRTNAWHSRA
jgi:hypothetical protein